MISGGSMLNGMNHALVGSCKKPGARAVISRSVHAAWLLLVPFERAFRAEAEVVEDGSRPA